MAICEQKEIAMNPVRKAQIQIPSKIQSKTKSGAKVGALLFHEAPTAIPTKYSNYSNIFLAENIAKFLEHVGINEHIIKLNKSKQPSFGLIYSL